MSAGTGRFKLPPRGLHVTVAPEPSPGEEATGLPEIWLTLTDEQARDIMEIAAYSRPGSRQAMIVTLWDGRREQMWWRMSRTAVERIRRRLRG